MNVNMMVLPALLGGGVLFAAGYWIARRTKSPSFRAVLVAGSFLLAIPALLMVFYYTHLFDHVAVYYEFRSWIGAELSAAGIGLFAGVATGLIRWQRRLAKVIAATVAVCVMSGIIILPHIKPILAPAKFSEMKDQWDGEICRQSTYHTCGPASIATVLHHFGIKATEIELAKECHTYISGTENWYLARAMRRRGLKVSFQFQKPVATIPVPCIAGIMNAGYGHFITILEDRGDSYLVGDPMLPALIVPKDMITKRFEFTGFFMPVSASDVHDASNTF